MTQQESYRTQIRFPGELYEQLKEVANKTGQSINAELVDRLAKSFEIDSDKFALERQIRQLESRLARIGADIMDIIEIERVFRMKHSGSTYGARDRLCTFVETVPNIQNVVFAVRDGNCNSGAMTILLQGKDWTLLADDILMTVERRPRELEVLELCQCLEKYGLLENSSFIVERIPATKEQNPDEVAEQLVKLNCKPFMGLWVEYLALFFDEPDKVEKDWFDEEWLQFN